MAIQVVTATFSAEETKAITYSDPGTATWGYSVGVVKTGGDPPGGTPWIDTATTTSANLNMPAAFTGTVTVVITPIS